MPASRSDVPATDTFDPQAARARILARIEAAAQACGRRGADVTLTAVSKQQPWSRVAPVVAAGQTVFGENRVQEAMERWGERRAGLSLRLIGPLQTNKADDAVAFFDAIESLDRERLAQAIADRDGLVGYLKSRHDLRVRRMPSSVMVGSTRRLDWHRREVLLDDSLDTASQTFQLALQVAYLEMIDEVEPILHESSFVTESGERLTRRALASYAAAAILMPYGAFARAVETRRYDVEALARQFGASFEQTAHRLTTLQKPGQERVPFFFIRVDPAGNVSKRLDGAGFPFARHGGGCPLWSVHHAFRRPREIIGLCPGR